MEHCQHMRQGDYHEDYQEEGEREENVGTRDLVQVSQREELGMQGRECGIRQECRGLECTGEECGTEQSRRGRSKGNGVIQVTTRVASKDTAGMLLERSHMR